MRIWIHGAWASPASFNYFKTQMTMDDDIMIKYDCNSDMLDTICRIKAHIERKTDEPVDLIGHSLGGVICLILYHLGLPCRSIITLCAPFGGLEHGFLFRWLFPHTMFDEFQKIQGKYKTLIDKEIAIPHQLFVATSGSNPLFFGKPNDGVVTVASQMGIKSKDFVKVDTNHYEILMNQDVTSQIQSFHRKLNKEKRR